MTTSFRIERTRDANRVYELMREHEPRASHCLSVALQGLNLRTNRCRLVYDQDGKLAAALVIHRVMLDGWVALPVLLDPASAPTVARIIDRSGSGSIHASVPDSELLTPHISRVRSTTYVRTVGMAQPIVWEPAEPECRVSRPDELDDLLDLYWRSDLNGFLSPKMLRKAYDENPDDILVYDEGNGPVAMMTYLGHTPGWDMIGDLIVHPDHRGKGISWKLVGLVAERATALGRGVFAWVRESNPMSLPSDAISDDDFHEIRLGPPRRFKGEGRLHRVGYKLMAQDQEREEARYFGRDRVDSERRTQQAMRDRHND